MEQYKVCTGCKANLPISSYTIHRRNKSGYRFRCKDCERNANSNYRARNRDKVNAAKRIYDANHKELKAEQDRRYREKNSEKIALRQSRWRKNNEEKLKAYRLNRTPEQKQHKRVMDKIYAANNSDRNRIASRKYRKNNPEKVSEIGRAWRQRNPEFAVNKSAQRRAKAKLNGAYLVTKKEIFKLRQSPCFYCGEKGQSTIDHIIPIARGGTHSIGNLVAACGFCNSSKSKLTITEWKKRRQAFEH